MIRFLSKEELGRIRDLSSEFFAVSKRPGTFNPEAFERLWRPLLDANLGVLLVSEVAGKINGLFGGVIHEDPYSGDLIATEQFWFVTPEARGSIGIRLLNSFEMEAARRGAKRILMIHLNNLTPESLRKLYERRGYRSIEQTYERVLN